MSTAQILKHYNRCSVERHADCELEALQTSLDQRATASKPKYGLNPDSVLGVHSVLGKKTNKKEQLN
jgi:hypothetical protein